MNRKSQLDKATSRAHELRGPEISSNEENENLQKNEPSALYKSKLPVLSKSKIPRLERPRRQQVSSFSEGLDASTEHSEQDTLSDQDVDLRVHTEAKKIADRHRSDLLRRMAEIKFQEELDYIQRKVQRTMGMVHFKGREERIREIEQELKEKLGDDEVKRDEMEEGRDGREEGRDGREEKMIVPLDNNNDTGVNDLKTHIEKEMTIQRREMDKLREDLKSEIARAMDDNYNKNEDLWHFIMEMNERRRSGRGLRRSRPYSDGVHLNKPTRPHKKIWDAERMSDG